jgi:hypothetical protein
MEVTEILEMPDVRQSLRSMTREQRSKYLRTINQAYENSQDIDLAKRLAKSKFKGLKRKG